MILNIYLLWSFLFLQSMAIPEKTLECLSSADRYEEDVAKSVVLAKTILEVGDINSTSIILGGGIASSLLPDANPMGLHYAMFTPTIAGQVIIIFLYPRN